MNSSSVTGTLVLATIFHPLAIGTTVFRLYYRFKISRLWWEDLWAAVALVFDITLFVAFWLQSNQPGAGPPHESRHTRIIAYWIVLESYTSVLWAARLSILVSIVRIIPPMAKMRRLAIGLAWAFPILWIGLIIQKAWVCGDNTSWYHSPTVACLAGTAETIALLCLQFFANCFLVAMPVRLLWRTNLDKNRRRLLLTLFSSSLLTTIASVSSFLVRITKLWTGQRSFMDVAAALIVCNLLVIVTYLYRVFLTQEDIESTAYYQRAGNPDLDTAVVTTRPLPVSDLPLGDDASHQASSNLTSVYADSNFVNGLRGSKEEVPDMTFASNAASDGLTG